MPTLSSHSAVLNLYTITSSDLDESRWCAFSSAVPQADGPEKEQDSIGIANDSTHLLYKVINSAISLFNNSKGQLLLSFTLTRLHREREMETSLRQDAECGNIYPC